MAMTARERIAEYATLKTLGFGAWHIAGVVFASRWSLLLPAGYWGSSSRFPRHAGSRQS